MDIKLNLNKRFVAALNRMNATYGEKVSKINGLNNSNLNFTDFIDHFIDSQTVADASIDANANSSTKDIRTLMGDMMKPHSKLLGYNKIFYEMTKKHGSKTANEWFDLEWNGSFYLHDSATVSFLPYCYLGEETLNIKHNDEEKYCSFKTLYNELTEEPVFDCVLNCFVKYPKNLFVRDVLNEEIVWTKILKIVEHNNNKKMRFIKCSNGLSQIVTEDHPVITVKGDVPASQITLEDSVSTLNSVYFSNSIEEIDGIKLTKELGWLVGMCLSEACSQPSSVTICQKLDSPQTSKILKILQSLNMEYTVSEKDNKIRLKVNNIQRFIHNIIKNKKSNVKSLPSDYVSYSFEFLDGVIAGMIDGDGTLDGYKNRHCQIRITSRELLNQLSAYLQFKKINVGDRVPYRTNSSVSFTNKLTMFGIGFPLTNEEYFSTIDSIKISERYTPLIRKKGNFKNKKYNYSYGENEIVENLEYIDNIDVVYDITTETGHFICNNILSHNCYAYDLTEVVSRGLFFVDKFKTGPAQHLTTYNDHVLEFISWAANRSSGACGLPNYLVYSYYFWMKDVKDNFYLKNPEYYRKQTFQKFIYDLNQPYLRISECAFTNISIMDRNYLIELFGGNTFPNGEFVIDHIDEIIEHQKVFMEVVAEIRKKCMMTFPVLTYSLLYQNGKFVDEEFAKWCNKHNMLWYDSNFYVGSDVTSLSNCCRLISDTSKLDAFINSIGGTALSVGSVKVNTINLRRIALETKTDKEQYLELLRERVQLCVKVLDVVRNIIKRNIEKGLLPNYTHGLIEMEKQYNTIGITAMYETIKEFNLIKEDEFGNKFYTEEGLKLAKEILNIINEEKDSFDLGYSINVECIPAERANAVLAEKDNLIFPDAKEAYYVYSNQWIPLIEKCSLQEKIKLGALLDKECGGGQISHINIQGPFTSEEQSWELLNKIAKAGVIYFAYNVKISTCENGHGFFGEECPECHQPKIDTFQRIVGYLTPTSTYSKPRKKEFNERRWFDFGEGSLT